MLHWKTAFSVNTSVRITLVDRVRYVLPRHKAANWVGFGRGRKSTWPGTNGVVKLLSSEFLNRLAGLVPRPLKHRHHYLEPPPVSAAPRPPTDWGEFVQAHDDRDRDVVHASPEELSVIDIRSS